MVQVRLNDGSQLYSATPAALEPAPDMRLRLVDDGFSLQDIVRDLKDNNRDDIVFKGENDRLYLLSVPEMTENADGTHNLFGSDLPSVGESIEAGGVKGEIVYVSNEVNANYVFANLASKAAVAAPLVGIAAGLSAVLTGLPGIVASHGMATLGITAAASGTAATYAKVKAVDANAQDYQTDGTLNRFSEKLAND